MVFGLPGPGHVAAFRFWCAEAQLRKPQNGDILGVVCKCLRFFVAKIPGALAGYAGWW